MTAAEIETNKTPARVSSLSVHKNFFNAPHSLPSFSLLLCVIFRGNKENGIKRGKRCGKRGSFVVADGGEGGGTHPLPPSILLLLLLRVVKQSFGS